MACMQTRRPQARVWRKSHPGIDEETLEAGAVEATGSDMGDAPVLPNLPSQLPADEQIARVVADGACDTRKCDAVILPRRTTKPCTAVTAGAVARNEALRPAKYTGRALWRR